jgi:hypothetical protein
VQEKILKQIRTQPQWQPNVEVYDIFDPTEIVKKNMNSFENKTQNQKKHV